MSIPGHGIRLLVRPTFPDQELATRQTTYWEGGCTISGTYQSEEMSGVGYTELTGYAASL